MAHATLLRTNTAPVFQASTDGVARLNNMSLSNAARASQLSGSTAFNSTTSLNSLTSSATAVTPVNGQPLATTNIINQRADASRSLYQICLSLKQRLAQVPGFEGYLEQLQLEQENGDDGPVEALWKLLRTGLPLLTIYNSLQPEKPLHVDERPNETEARRSKRAIMEFVKACLSDLDPPVTECFIVADLTGEDTTGFVKVSRSPRAPLPFPNSNSSKTRWKKKGRKKRKKKQQKKTYMLTGKCWDPGDVCYQLCARSCRKTGAFAPNPTIPRR